MAQLRKAANVYRRAFAVFFLSEPPAQPVPLHDFRRLLDGAPGRLSPELLLEMRRARRRRAVAADLLSDLGYAVPEFPLRARLSDDPEEVAAEEVMLVPEVAAEELEHQLLAMEVMAQPGMPIFMY